MDIEIAKTKDKLHWSHWKKVKSGDMSDEYSDWVPRNILYFNSFVEDLFNTKTKAEAFEMMAKNFLDKWSADFPLWLNTTDVTIFPNFDSSFDSDIYLDNPCIDCNQRVSYGKNQNPNP